MILDFVDVVPRVQNKKTVMTPTFNYEPSSCHMTRGGDMYAVWDEDTGLWSRDKYRLVSIVDGYLREVRDREDPDASVAWLKSSHTRSFTEYLAFCKNSPDRYVDLDRKIIFTNSTYGKDDYASFKLNYSMTAGPCPNYDRAMAVWFDPPEQEKLEWFVGYIISGQSMIGQKCLVIYGDPGTGKGSWLKVVQGMFGQYVGTFKASDLGKPADAFPAEAFVDNKRIMIDPDCDLSLITDNTIMNIIISHEPLLMNAKFSRKFTMEHPDSALIMGTNKPVYITDSKSGMQRRLIDAYSSGRKFDPIEYEAIMRGMTFEYGAIAQRCLDVYNRLGPNYFANYIPIRMFRATNDFFNFVDYWRDYLVVNDPITARQVWDLYQKYCDIANIVHKKKMKAVENEMKDYYVQFQEDTHLNGVHIRKLYSGFKKEKFNDAELQKKYIASDDNASCSWLDFRKQASRFDIDYADWPAQLAKEDGTPLTGWDFVGTKLSDLDTTQLHYVLPKDPLLIMADFDMKNEKGEKDFDLNAAEASKFPPTYAELSKSGGGIHLYYIYTGGDPSELSRVFDYGIEIKVFTGKSSIRRKLSLCNDLPIATINSGLPLKEKKGGPVVGTFTINSERQLRKMIARNLNKEYLPSTKQSIDYIYDLLEMAYNEEGLHYDVHDMQGAIFEFGMRSTNNYKYCIQRINQMHFVSKETAEFAENGTPAEAIDIPVVEEDTRKIVITDVEVFPNHWGYAWMYVGGERDSIIIVKDPTPFEVQEFIQSKFMGFNNRAYDNDIFWAATMGYSISEIYQLSQNKISGKSRGFAEAKRISYGDIHDISSTKQSLKKWEIFLKKQGYDVDHQECRFRWDQEVTDEEFDEVMQYCANDVWATNVLFQYKSIQADYRARCMLAKLSGLTVNDTSRMHTTRIIFGDNKNPSLEYRDLSEEFPGYEFIEDETGKHNMYMGEDAGLGGYVYACHGPRYDEVSPKDKGYFGAMACNVALLDIESLHPNSIRQLNLFGEYTKRYTDILDARLAIKHGDYDKVATLLDGALVPFLGSKEDAKDLSQALKIIINSVYGYTSAQFDNPFKDPRNRNNIVALRGALFMILLKNKVLEKGYAVLHIKTDSIKIPNATPSIIQFCKDFAKQYGYTFAHEATYSKMCLVNQSTYIAQYASPDVCMGLYGYVPGDNKDAAEEGHKWTATGTQFQVPYVFKTLFTKEPIIFSDLCETKSVTSGDMWLDMNENIIQPVPVESLEKEREDRLWNAEHVRKRKLHYETMPDSVLEQEINRAHNYIYVGRVGSFCPMLPGAGGGLLMRKTNEGKYAAVTGTTGYRWLESEDVKKRKQENDINRGYYDRLVDQAVEDISIYGDFEWFTDQSDEKIEAIAAYVNRVNDEEMPFEEQKATA